MNDAPLADAVRARMQLVRCEIDEDVEDMVASARSMVDWKHYVRTYPWVCLGTAAVLGFLILPRPSTAVRVFANLAELAKTGRPVVKPAAAPARRLVDGCWPPSPTSRFARQPHMWAKAPDDYWNRDRSNPPRPRPAAGGAADRAWSIRMVGETTMNRCKGPHPSPPNGVAKNVRELMHDIMSLAELAFELFKIDCREGLQRMLMPIALLLVAGIVAVGTAPIALIFVAELLVQTAGLSRTAAFSIAALMA